MELYNVTAKRYLFEVGLNSIEGERRLLQMHIYQNCLTSLLQMNFPEEH